MAKPKPPEVPNIRELIHGMGAIVEGVVKKSLEDFANKSATKFKEMLHKQEFQSFKDPPLSPGWAIYKATHKLDPRVMIATGNYVESIKVFKIKNGWRIGFEDGAMAIDEDGEEKAITLDQLAAIHEKTRPHWGPFREIMKKDLASLLPTIRSTISREVPGRLHVPKIKAP